MLSIKEYYNSAFRNDIISFMGNSTVPYFGHSWEYDCRGLENISTEKRHLFLICLYFTVLVDQVMYSYYRNYYSKFEELTQYPKFCHGLGQHQKNPRAILYLPADKGLVDKKLLVEHLENGMKLFVEETVDFISKYTPGIDINEFFNKLVYDPDVQIPEIFVMLDNKVKDNVDYIAYRALVNAVDTIVTKRK